MRSRDILPEAEDLLYKFIESPYQIPEDRLAPILGQYTEQLREALLANLLWYGFLGVVRLTGEIDYIYTVNYDMKMLNAIVTKLRDTGLVYSASIPLSGQVSRLPFLMAEWCLRNGVDPLASSS